MTLNLSKTVLTFSSGILLVAACITLATKLTVDRTGRDMASQKRALSSEDIAEIDWSVYRQW